MYTFIVTIFIIFLQFNKISCQLDYGSVFPISLTIINEDPYFQHCPNENGVYAHRTNCSLFHMCTFGIHTIYTCIDGFFFNPNNSRCQQIPIVNEIKCEIILQKMIDTNVSLLTESVQDYKSYYHRKSATSKCTQTGIYPDILDCSLFHYCRQNKHHQIFKCQNELHFDPKTFMCAPSELVNCQYEPSRRIADKNNRICRDHPPGTYLPMTNRFDMYIICGDDGKSISMRCKSGLIYNALTTACEKGPCTFDSTLCQNDGQCIDDSIVEKGFKCICSSQFQGEYLIDLEETTEPTHTKEIMKQSSDYLLQKSTFDETTHVPYNETNNLHRNKHSTITNKVVNNVSQDNIIFDSSSEQQQQLIKTTFIIIVVFFGVILFVSITFAIVTLTRIILYSSNETVHEWKTLQEESNI